MDECMHSRAEDEAMMRAALAEAHAALSEGEIPIGAVVAARGRIVGRGHNMTERLGDVTAHAEMQAITAAEAALGGKYLSECTLYVTVEPCLMCAGAIGWSQVRRIVIGAPDEKRGYSTMVSRCPFHPKAVVTTGILLDECRQLMVEFFRNKRQQ